ncbi:MAG: glycoside hydrolase family 78 protein [Acidobacteria bacterium]|nr:glycoside hydrolase family 78 protein [Acidobacteriota bacterium]MCI0717431.1 glycoside hydrolase family 78 protein [Acidobacteriota bacterium]
MSFDRLPFLPLTRRDLLKLLPQGIAGWALPLVADKLPMAPSGTQAPEPTEKHDWLAKWIWCDGEPAPLNFYLYCRRAFTLQGAAAQATTHVAADSRYKLFVNGMFVGRGPARCDQRWQYYDTYDVRPFLQQGENVVSAIVHQYGAPSHSYTLGRGGLFLDGEMRERSGRVVRFDTDGNWRVLPAPPWDRESPRTCVAVMWQEIYDARKEPVGWQRPGYHDSHWRRPVVLGTHPVLPWQNLIPRDIPFLLEQEMFPSGILNSGIADPAPPALRLEVPRLLGRSDGQVAYLFAYLNSPVRQEVAFAVRGREGMPPMLARLWLNGEGPAQPQGPPLGPTPSTNILNLRKGWNELLLKLGRFSPAWYWELALGPAPKQQFTPIEWYADPDPGTRTGRAWIAGPYGELRPGTPGGPGAFEQAYEPEKVILGRSAGTPVHLPGKIVELDMGPPKNVALLIATENRRPQPTHGIQNIHKLLHSGEGPVLVSTAATDGPVYATLDFGKEVAGYVRLRLNGVAGGIVDLGYCETLVDGHVDTLRDNWSFADRYIMRDGPQEWELFFWKGFRYLQLTFRNCSKPVEVEAVRLLFTSYPVEYRGSFECSDPLLTKIWEVGRWTLQLCMHDAYEDCPWREQGQWCGDAQVELSANYATFGDVALGTKCLRQIAQGQNESGALPAEYPADVAVYPTRQSVPFGIPPFMAQWVTMLLEHYRYTSDSKLASELYPNLVRVMSYLARFIDEDGLLNNVPGFGFLDWTPELMGSPQGSDGELTGINCHYHRALLDGAALAGVVGETDQQSEWLNKAERLRHAINARLWSEEHGVYAHARKGGRLDPKLAVHDSILAAYAGVAPPDRVSTSFRNLFGQPRQDVVQIGTPYFYYFYLQALRLAGLHQEVLEATRRAYGKMLEAGATTWWEHFGGFASLCHAWSCAPNSDLSAYVLGVQLTEPGFASFRVEPYPADLNWARGVVPTPRGDVSVSWKRENSAFELNVTAPMQAVVELSVPADSLQSTHFTGSRTPDRQRFSSGRTRYWVQAPGTFRVRAKG